MKILLDKNNKPVGRERKDGTFKKSLKGERQIECQVTRREAVYIVKHCELKNNKFYINNTDVSFDEIKSDLEKINIDNFVKVKDKDNDKVLEDQLLEIHNTKDLNIIRKEYFEQTLPLIGREGFDRLASAIAFGCFSEIARALSELPAKSKEIFMEHKLYSDELKNLMINTWRVFP